MEDLKTYRLKITEDEGIVYNISLVEEPAIEEDFMVFEDVKNVIEMMEFKKTEPQKMELTGPVMIPDLPILRYNNGQYFNVIFTKEDILYLRDKWSENGYGNNINLHHKYDTTDTFVVEQWIIEDSTKDKAAALGFSLPIGTWMATVKVKNKKLWDEEVMTGNVKGFSIEVKDFKMEPVNFLKVEEESETLKMAKAVLEEYKRCGAENFAVAADRIRLAMDTRQLVQIWYEGSLGIKPGYRVIEIYAYGLSLAYNRVIRAWQKSGVSLSGEEKGWKLFLAERITDWKPLKTRYEGTRPNFNAADKGMSVVYQTIRG